MLVSKMGLDMIELSGGLNGKTVARYIFTGIFIAGHTKLESSALNLQK